MFCLALQSQVTFLISAIFGRIKNIPKKRVVLLPGTHKKKQTYNKGSVKHTFVFIDMKKKQYIFCKIRPQTNYEYF